MSLHHEDRAVLGLLVVLLRALRHWSQADLAKASGIQKSQISLYELGKTAPTEATLKRLAAAAGVPWAAVRQALPALRELVRLVARPAGWRAGMPGARKLAAAVGRAAAGALRERVRPFLRERLPALAGAEPEAPESLPDRRIEAAAVGLLIGLLRSLRHWTQEDLADASGVQRSQISAYELGKKAPRRPTLERLATAVGAPLDEAMKVLSSLCELVQAARGGSGGKTAMAVGAGRLAEDFFLLEVEPFLLERLPALSRQAAVQEARRRAEVLVQDLIRRSTAERRRMVEQYEPYRTWAVCERAALASAGLAGHDAAEAVELARLAVRMAELTPGGEGWRSRTGGLCWGLLANALRVKGEFPAADEGFVRSDQLWQDGAAADPGLILDGMVLLELKACLRRHQGRFEESLDLLKKAQAASRSDEVTARILLGKSFTLNEMGDWQGTIETLQQACPLVEKQGDLRSRWVLEFNLCSALTDAGRHAEAEKLLPKVRGLALALGNGLDLLRCRWLQGRLSAGQGKLEEAVADLEAVAAELVVLGIAFDAAQACLDLAELHLQQGRTAEVRRLAGQIVAVFQAQKVDRESLAAVILFQEAAEHERATAELARKLSTYLRRAEHDPALRFTP